MEESTSFQPRSSGRERKRPRRYSLSPPERSRGKTRDSPRVSSAVAQQDGDRVAQSSEKKSKKQRVMETATPKSILTPSRKGTRGRPRKSVVFDQDNKDIEKQLGFRDIDPSPQSVSVKSNEKISPSERKSRSKLRSPRKATKNTISTATESSEREPKVASDDDDDIVDDGLEKYLLSVGDEPAEVSIHQDENEFNKINIDEEDAATLAIKSHILTRLTGRGSVEVFPHLKTHYDTLHLLLEATVTSGESNSLLLLGARGTGKSRLLNAALSDLESRHRDQFHTIRLNGFYQTDDRLALREIWRQLGREMQVDEAETDEIGGSHADTMASLLSLLSHPDEFSVPDHDGDGREGERVGRDPHPQQEFGDDVVHTSKSVVFVLDEFDLFTTHPRQTLLYNLFDIAQSKKAPVAVVGCSTRLDVVDCLEKRVKSRFSQRWLHVPAAKTLADFEAIVGHALCYQATSGTANNRSPEISAEAIDRWNTYIKTTLLPSPSVQDLISHHFYATKSVPDLLSALYIPIATARLPEAFSDKTTVPATTIDYATAQPSVFALLSTLPTLHLALLIAASRLDTIHNVTNLNFNLVYTHYAELLSRARLQVTASGAVAVGASLRQWNRQTAQSAWEDLGVYECIVPVSRSGVTAAGPTSGKEAGGRGDSIGGDGANVRLWRVETTLDDLEWAVKQRWTESGGVRDLLSRWCREI